jgi:hypothetical protein
MLAVVCSYWFIRYMIRIITMNPPTRFGFPWGILTAIVYFTPVLAIIYLLALSAVAWRFWSIRSLFASCILILVIEALLIWVARTPQGTLPVDVAASQSVNVEAIQFWCVSVISVIFSIAGIYLFGFNKDMKALFGRNAEAKP